MEHKPPTVDWLVELALWEGQGTWATRMDEAAVNKKVEKRHLERMRTHIEVSMKRAAKEDQASNVRYNKTVDMLQPWEDRFSKQILGGTVLTSPQASNTSRKRF